MNSPGHCLIRHRAVVLPILAAAASLFPTPARATDGSWTSAIGGNWSDPANWLGGIVADGADGTADFSTLDLLAPNSATVDLARTIGILTFGDTDPLTPFAWTVNSLGAVLTLQTTAGTPVITTNFLTGAVAATISAPIAGTQGFIKSGAGTLAISGASTNTGNIVINQGTLNLEGTIANANIAANSGSTLAFTGATTSATLSTATPIQLDNATLDLSSGPNGLNGSNVVTLVTSSTFNATFTGAKNINFLGAGGSLIGSSTLSLNLAFTDTANSFLTLGIGGGANPLSVFTGTIAFTPGSNGIIRFGNGGSASSAGVYGNAGMKVDFGASSATIRPRNAATTIIFGELQSASTTSILNGPVSNNGTATYQIGGLNTDSIFNGRIIDNPASALRQSALTKVGTGTLTLANNNTFTGATNVNAGTLLINGSLGATTVTVSSGATLGGKGIINGNVSLLSGGNLLVGTGSASDTLTLGGNLDALVSTAVFRFALGALGHSTLARTGTGTWNFDPAATFSFIDDGAVIGLYDNIITGLAADPVVAGWTAMDGWEGQFIYDGAGNVDFNLTAIAPVPEPGTLSLLLGAAGLGFFLARRRGRI